MSRSNNTEYPNPAVRFYQWNGESGGFRFWDKSLGDKGERVDVALPFRFMVLDCLSTIKGFNDADSSGYWSNEVRDIKKDILTVRTKKGIVAKGVYSEVITNRACKGAKYCQSVYIAIREADGLLAIANLQLTGAALSSWIEFRQKHKKIYDGAIEVAKMVEGKKGATTYQIPVFKVIETTTESDELAKNLDRELQEYLAVYFKRTRDEIAETHDAEMNHAAEDDYAEHAQRQADAVFAEEPDVLEPEPF